MEIMQIPETHVKGLLTIEKDITSQICDLGIQISKNGKIWLCVNGEAFIRFRPISTKLVNALEPSLKSVKGE